MDICLGKHLKNSIRDAFNTVDFLSIVVQPGFFGTSAVQEELCILVVGKLKRESWGCAAFWWIDQVTHTVGPTARTLDALHQKMRFVCCSWHDALQFNRWICDAFGFVYMLHLCFWICQIQCIKFCTMQSAVSKHPIYQSIKIVTCSVAHVSVAEQVAQVLGCDTSSVTCAHLRYEPLNLL